MANNNKMRQNSPKGGGQSTQIEHLPTDSLVPYARNARTHSETQIAQIAASITEFGFCNPVLIDKDGGIIAGHGRVMAATLLGMDTIPCLRLSHLTEAQQRAYVIADNQIALNSGWDEDLLALELADLSGLDFDLDLLGFDAADLPGLMGEEPAEASEVDAEPQIDRAEELRKVWGTEQGQLWRLGSHRLLCGDSRDSATVSRLIYGAKINIAFTSPPYASQRKYDESSGFRPVPPDEYVAWWEPLQACVREHLAPDGSFFVNIKEHCDDGQRHLYVKDLTIAHVRLWGWRFVDEFCWLRPGVPGRWPDRFKNGFEPVAHYARGAAKFRPESVSYASDAIPVKSSSIGAVTSCTNGAYWNRSADSESGMAFPSNVVECAGVERGTGHAAAFPVGLPTFFIKAYTDEQDAVYEPFCGSGSTLIAAENTGRICYGMEISPAYVAVILQRFQDATGKTPVLVGDV